MAATAQGVVKSAGNGKLVLKLSATQYELHLESALSADPGSRIKGTVCVQARKVWTISAGGSFTSPLVGPPRVIQGRIKSVDGNRLVVQAGFPVSVEMPQDKTGLDLKNGPLQAGVMVNITAYPGARFEVAQ